MYKIDFEMQLRLDNPSFSDERVKSIMDEYAHLSDAELKEYIERMEESFDEIEGR